MSNIRKFRTSIEPGDYMVEDRGYKTPCWIFRHERKQPPKGVYSRPVINGKRVGAHRYMYEQEVGPIPEGLTIDHLCFQHNCIRPDHLEPVSQPENVRRYHRQSNRRRFSAEEIIFIRSFPTGYGTRRFLAKKFSVSEGMIRHIRNRATYADI